MFRYFINQSVTVMLFSGIKSLPVAELQGKSLQDQFLFINCPPNTHTSIVKEICIFILTVNDFLIYL